MKESIQKIFRESISVKQNFVNDGVAVQAIESATQKMTECLKSGGKLVICGNGGSASDALHFAGEIVGRFQLERQPWPTVVLNADVATLTAIANDYGYEEAFARQAEAHINAGDVFVGISTSGNSENVYRATAIANKKGAYTVGLLGKDGGKIGKQVDCPIIVPYSVTARVQECHILIIHTICELIEKSMGLKVV